MKNCKNYLPKKKKLMFNNNLTFNPTKIYPKNLPPFWDAVLPRKLFLDNYFTCMLPSDKIIFLIYGIKIGAIDIRLPGIVDIILSVIVNGSRLSLKNSFEIKKPISTGIKE